MIKEFPNFSKLILDNRKQIENITCNFEPYSDFNFTSLFCWNIDKTSSVSILNNNLVINIPDYITSAPVYSLIGVNNIDESMNALLKITSELKLVPKITVDNINNASLFNIYEDIDHDDYVYNLEKQSELAGGLYKNKRKRVNKFMRIQNEAVKMFKINFKNPTHRKIVLQIFKDWAIDRNKDKDKILNEQKAIKKLLRNSGYFDLMGIIISIGSKSVGFSINEILRNGYSICHFQKTITSYSYLDDFLTNVVAKELNHIEIKYVNWEQDLGLEGLRQLKSSYLPDLMLKKFTISKKLV